jgi:hypothetical protein
LRKFGRVFPGELYSMRARHLFLVLRKKRGSFFECGGEENGR